MSMNTLRVALSIRETAHAMGVHENTVRRAIARGELNAVSFGRRRLIPTQDVLSLLTGQPTAEMQVQDPRTA